MDREKQDLFFSSLNLSLTKGVPSRQAIEDSVSMLIAVYYPEHPEHPDRWDDSPGV